MLKHYILTFIIVFNILGFSQELLVENFSYTANTDMANNGWNVLGTNNAGNSNVAYQGLTFTGYSGSGIGLADTIVGTSSRDEIGKSFTQQTSGSVFYSFLVRVSAFSSSYFTGIQATIGTTYNLRLFAVSSGAGFKLGLGTGASGSYAATPTEMSLNTTYLVVVKYTIVSGTGNDVVKLFVFNSTIPGTEPSSPEVSITMGTDFNPGAIFIRQDASGISGLLDGIRVATSWDYSPLPVELTSFTASARGTSITLNWETKTEVDNNGFEVERNANGTWQKIGFVEGHGTANSPKYYSFVDNGVVGNKIQYRLRQVDNDGSFEYSPVVEVELNPTEFALYQNYPNPFNPSTMIRFSIPVGGTVALNVFNTLGEKVAALLNGQLEAGYHEVSFDASNLPSGLYFYEIKTGDFSSIKKMILMK